MPGKPSGMQTSAGSWEAMRGFGLTGQAAFALPAPVHFRQPPVRMFAKVYSGAVYGVDAYEVEIEVNAAGGNPVIVVFSVQEKPVSFNAEHQKSNYANFLAVILLRGSDQLYKARSMRLLSLSTGKSCEKQRCGAEGSEERQQPSSVI